MKTTGQELRDIALDATLWSTKPEHTRQVDAACGSLIRAAHEIDTDASVRRIRKIGLGRAPMYLHLFHGRTSPAQELDDWGADGPVLKIEGFHVTYLSTYRIGVPGENDWEDLHFVEDLLYYNGMYYGDWSILAHTDDENDLIDRSIPVDITALVPPQAPVPSLGSDGDEDRHDDRAYNPEEGTEEDLDA